MRLPELSLNEWVVLGLLAEQPRHGFGVAKELSVGADLGRILTVHRPLVYRAIDRLADGELVERLHTEPGNAAPRRTVYRITARGRRVLRLWLAQPVAHVRDLRIEFLAKLRLLQRSSRESTPLVRAQQAELASAFDTLSAAPAGTAPDVVDLWRRHASSAARQFLTDLNDRAGGSEAI